MDSADSSFLRPARFPWIHAECLPLDALRPSRVAAIIRSLDVRFRRRIFTPWATLWTWLLQCLAADRSCRSAVSWLAAQCGSLGLPAVSTRSSAYCQARKRLSVELVKRLVRESGAELHGRRKDDWTWRGRRVKIIDGTTLILSDTAANADAFGKPRNHSSCPVFPLMRLLTVFCLATGAVLDAALAPYRGKSTSELALLRGLLPHFSPADLLLGDRFYATYYDLFLIQARGIDGLFRTRDWRLIDFRRGRRLGRMDHVVDWKKPEERPAGVAKADWAAVPKRLTVRELRTSLSIPGFRVRTLTLVTTLLDPEAFPKESIAECYRLRWQAELNLRSLKSTLGMARLRCKTPDMAEKEAWMHLLACNVIRSLHVAAARTRSAPPRELSFAAARQLLEGHRSALTTPTRPPNVILAGMVMEAAKHRVNDRPNRFEPRKIRTLHNDFPRLKRPRNEERQLLLSAPLAA